MFSMAVCYFCGKEIPQGERVYRSSRCLSCGKDIKICLNCEFYSPGSQWDCREAVSEPVEEKDSANFCEYFSLAHTTRKTSEEEKRKSARSKFDNLFGNG